MDAVEPAGSTAATPDADGEDLGEATFALTITDGNGNHIRTLEAPSEAGINEVIWDWRHDPPYEPEPRQGGGAPQGPIVLPGYYRVSMTVAGETFSAEFEVHADPRRPVASADRKARQHELMRLHTLAVPIYEAGRAIEKLEEQLDAAEELIGAAAEPPEGVKEEVDSIRAALEQVQDDLQEASRNAGLAGAIEQSSTLPTEDQLWQVDRAWEVMEELVGPLNELITSRVPALNARLYAEGVRPAVGEVVRVPGG